MSLPRQDELGELLSWSPPHGVLSVYLAIDPGDRGGGWHTALKDELAAPLEQAAAADHEMKEALRATVTSVQNRFSDRDHPPACRGVVGFAEIARKGGEQRWFESGVEPRCGARVSVSDRPCLQPLVELLDDNRPRGVVAVSGERARIFRWEGRELEEIVDSEILTTGDWRERKAPGPSNVPTGQGISSSGHDQHEQRLEHHRQGFIKQVAAEVARLSDEHGWTELIGFGESRRLAELADDLPDGKLVHREDANVIPEPAHEIAARLAALAEPLNRTREAALLDAAENAAAAGGRGSLGLVETAQSLAEARVHHLLLAADALPPSPGADLVEAMALEGQLSDRPTAELLIERALRTDAAVTPVEGDAAERLAALGGAAAILRY